jgi:hypothetical protein
MALNPLYARLILFASDPSIRIIRAIITTATSARMTTFHAQNRQLRKFAAWCGEGKGVFILPALGRRPSQRIPERSQKSFGIKRMVNRLQPDRWSCFAPFAPSR